MNAVEIAGACAGHAGDFNRVHAVPQSGQDVPDDMDARLVVLGIDHPYSKDSGNAAEVAAKAIFESRGSSPRLFRNTLVFLAVDQTRLQELDDAVRRYLAWESIVANNVTLDLTPNQAGQAEAKKAKIEMNYISGDEVAKAFHEMMHQKPEVLEAMAKYLQPSE